MTKVESALAYANEVGKGLSAEELRTHVLKQMGLYRVALNAARINHHAKNKKGVQYQENVAERCAMRAASFDALMRKRLRELKSWTARPE